MLLKADEGTHGPGWPDEQIAEAFGAHSATVSKLRQRLVEEGLEAALERKKRRDYPRKIDGDAEAHLVAMVCGKPPDGYKRWSIEMLVKDEKQHLGLGDYRVLRYRAVVRHLCLVDCAYACLTHLGIQAQRAQGQHKNKRVLRLEPVSKLKERMCRIAWQQNVEDVIKHSHEKPVIRRLEKLLAA
jgi:transposase